MIRPLARASAVACFALSFTFVLVSTADKAVAQEKTFGQRGQLVLSAERLTGFVHTRMTTSVGGQSMSDSATTLTLLGNPLGLVASGYAWPRIALDGFVAENVSLGAAVTFFHVSPEEGSSTGVVLAPRVGYSARLSPRVAIWPRLGFTYARVSSSNDTVNLSSKQSLFALTVEAPIVISVVPQGAITVGPTLDLGLGGSRSQTVGGGGETSIDQKFTDFGIQAGLLLFF